MVQQKAAAFVFSSSLIISLFCYNYYDNFRVDVKTRVKIREPFYSFNDSDNFLINTIGCQIPNYGKHLKFIKTKDFKQSCGERAIFVKRIGYDQINFEIDSVKMGNYAKTSKKYECCYKFASRSKIVGKEDTALSYTPCKPFQSGVQTALLQEVITVTCYTSEKKTVIYKDAYIVLKKRTDNKGKAELNKQTWNVLLLGMDTMSRARIFNTMPKTVAYLHKDGWLDYKGYQKVGYNTYPNLMSLLTGMNMSSINKACRPDMYSCNDHMIWSTFRKAGYTTAYGEDDLRLPDTFFNYNGFKSTPTHHYMRPFFLTGEQQKGNLICTEHLPSAKHILDYAYDFADTYKNEGFFGMFWINSYSHNIENVPSLFENYVLNFFDKANRSGILDNTIIVFLSDHGIRYGPTRISMESHYEERLPMFFVWVPNEFRKRNEEEYYNLQLNQNRLVTPYDLHTTLVKICNMSVSLADTTSAVPTSLLGTSLLEEVSTFRTCEDAGVSRKWCSCHEMNFINTKTDRDAMSSLQLVVSYIQNKSDNVKTIDCNKCHSLQLDVVLRTHLYKDGNKTYYVVAFQVMPGKIGYEAIVLKDNNELSILGGIDTLTGYNSRGNCVKQRNDRAYCVCKRVKCRR